ncbi:MAG: hypothetical protein WC483_00620 [Candidatus Paceibacterota bacterium]
MKMEGREDGGRPHLHTSSASTAFFDIVFFLPSASPSSSSFLPSCLPSFPPSFPPSLLPSLLPSFPRLPSFPPHCTMQK